MLLLRVLLQLLLICIITDCKCCAVVILDTVAMRALAVNAVSADNVAANTAAEGAGVVYADEVSACISFQCCFCEWHMAV